MILKEREYKKCESCGLASVIISDQVIGCDNCCKEIPEDADCLQSTSFWKEADAKHHDFCSWRCFFLFARAHKTDYFIDLPYLSFDNKTIGTRPVDFWAFVGV